MGQTVRAQVLSLTLLLASVVGFTAALKIGAFNVKIFGVKKMENQDVVNILIKIIRRYDIILIEEIRDKSGASIQNLLQQVNRGKPQYAMVLSRRLGRTSAKEQFAFLYRSDRNIQVVDELHWKDSEDLFEREPFAVRFKVPACETPNFVLVGVHLDPDDVEREIEALVQVETAVKRTWHVDNILFMGDFNADCKYLSNKAKARLSLRTDRRYKWLLGDEIDTTVKATNCAYDRFVMVGRPFSESLVPRSVQAFRFDEEYELSNEMAERVSDHYPIGLELVEDQAVGQATPLTPHIVCLLVSVGLRQGLPIPLP